MGGADSTAEPIKDSRGWLLREGRATCFLIDQLSPTSALEIHCVDTWEGGIEHQATGRHGGVAMETVRERFLANTGLAIRKAQNKVDLVIHRGRSDVELATMIASKKTDLFDLIYIDGSHEAPDVLCDAVLCFRLLREGGLLVFDDYLWSEYGGDKLDAFNCPKPAIDAFVNIYRRKIAVLSLPLYQLYVQKIRD